MKNGTYDYVCAFPCEVLVSELQSGVETTEAGVKTQPSLLFQHLNIIWVKTQPHIALWTFKSFHGFFFAEHIPHYTCFAFFRPVITILHFGPDGGVV